MKKSVNAVLGASIAAILFLAGHASAATYPVELSATTGNIVNLELSPGTYVATPLDDPLGWNAWSGNSVSGCDSSGANCAKGWLHQYHITVGGSQQLVASGRFSTPEAAFAAAEPFTFSITGATSQIVTFQIIDDPYTDNSGGVSLSVSQVPLPAAAWLFLSAIAGMAGVKRAKRSKASSVLA